MGEKSIPLAVLLFAVLLLALFYLLFSFRKPLPETRLNLSVFSRECEEREEMDCTTNGCSGKRICANGYWSACVVERVCTPGTKTPCENEDSCIVGYRVCNECGTAYGRCIES